MFRRSVPTLRQLSQSNRLLSSVGAADADHTANPSSSGSSLASKTSTASSEAKSAKSRLSKRSAIKELKTPKINDVFVPPTSPSEPRKEFRRQLGVLEEFPNQQTIRGCHRLVDLHKAMDLYRKALQSSTEQRAENCTPLIHMILSSMRLREVVFRPLIHKLKDCLKGEQDVVFKQLLEELITDIVAKRARVSAYGVVWILQSLETLGSREAATAAWYRLQKAAADEIKEDKRVIESDSDPERAAAEIARQYRLQAMLDTPAATGAAINCADHAALDVAKAQAMYDAYHERTGDYDCILDDAMTRYLLEEGDYEAALSLYTLMLERHNTSRFEGTLARLNNQLLADIANVDYADAIFRHAVAKGSMNQRLHPASVAAFLKRYYEQTKNLDGVLERYQAALEAINSSYQTEGDQLNTQIARKQVMEIITDAFKGDVAAGIAKLRQTLELEQSIFNVSTIAANTALSCTYKGWPNESSAIYEMATDVLKHESESTPLQIDSLRTLLCAAGYSSDITNEMVGQWVDALAVCCKDAFSFYDLRAFIGACVGSNVWLVRKDFLFATAAELLNRKFFDRELLQNVRNSIKDDGCPERIDQLIEILPFEAGLETKLEADAATEREVAMREGYKPSIPSKFKSRRRKRAEQN